MSEVYKSFDQIEYSNSPFEMKTNEIRSELNKIMPLLKDNYGTAYCNAIIARIEQYQSELTRRNIKSLNENISRLNCSTTVFSILMILLVLAQICIVLLHK